MKRDPDKSARNRIIATYKKDLDALLPKVLSDTGAVSQQSLNALIGSKNDHFFDLKNEVVNSPEEFKNKWLKGLKVHKKKHPKSTYNWVYDKAKLHPSFKKYLILFLERSYLRHYEELSKNRPKPSQSELWIGQSNASYGLLVTPRFVKGQWENDKSEIRAFKEGYWTIGHVMNTGLVIPGKNKIFKFSNVDQYLLFFTDALVRNSGSKHEYELACHYADFVKNSDKPMSVPLLIPEYRYLGLEKKHMYRLVFLVINPYTMRKIGFELSPWSSHGYLGKLKGLTQKKINELAADNFEKEMNKHRAYFKKHDIVTLIYTDEKLKNSAKLFRDEVSVHLDPEKPATQLSFEVMEEFN